MKQYQIKRKKDFVVIKPSAFTKEQAAEIAKSLGVPAIYTENFSDLKMRDKEYIEKMLKAIKT